MYFQKLNKEVVDHAALDALNKSLDAYKPGLTSKTRTGAEDISYFLYRKGLEFLKGVFGEAYMLGREYSCVESQLAFEAFRGKGRPLENKLLDATGGVSTHKGAMFALGLMSAAVGKLDALGIGQNIEYLTTVIADYTRDLSYRTFLNLDTKSSPYTGGEMLYKKYKFTSLRGYAEEGFAGIFEAVIPFLRENPQSGRDEDFYTKLFILIMSVIKDGNILLASGEEAMQEVQEKAKKAYDDYSPESVQNLDAWLLSKEIAPKASATILALVLFTESIIKEPAAAA